MKFWQLSSIAREQPGLLSKVASQQADWRRYGDNADDIGSIVDRQDREILDEEVDPKFAEAVLSRVKTRLYLGVGWLRSRRLKSEEEISALEAASRFGGEAVEDALEYGSTKV